MKKAFIFDLDGTLLDTVPSIAYYCNKALEFYGFPTNAEEKYKYFAGDGAVTLIHRALNENGLDTEQNHEKVFKKYIELYDKNSSYKTGHFKGMPETLEKLKELGFVLAITSNKPFSTMEAVLPLFFDTSLFDVMLGGGINIPLKPEPDMVLKVLEETGIKKSDAIYVGDTGTDMLTGKNAGLYTVGVSWGFRDRKELIETGADIVIDSPEQLLDLI